MPFNEHYSSIVSTSFRSICGSLISIFESNFLIVFRYFLFDRWLMPNQNCTTAEIESFKLKNARENDRLIILMIIWTMIISTFPIFIPYSVRSFWFWLRGAVRIKWFKWFWHVPPGIFCVENKKKNNQILKIEHWDHVITMKFRQRGEKKIRWSQSIEAWMKLLIKSMRMNLNSILNDNLLEMKEALRIFSLYLSLSFLISYFFPFGCHCDSLYRL